MPREQHIQRLIEGEGVNQLLALDLFAALIFSEFLNRDRGKSDYAAMAKKAYDAAAALIAERDKR